MPDGFLPLGNHRAPSFLPQDTPFGCIESIQQVAIARWLQRSSQWAFAYLSSTTSPSLRSTSVSSLPMPVSKFWGRQRPWQTRSRLLLGRGATSPSLTSTSATRHPSRSRGTEGERQTVRCVVWIFYGSSAASVQWRDLPRKT